MIAVKKLVHLFPEIVKVATIFVVCYCHIQIMFFSSGHITQTTDSARGWLRATVRAIEHCSVGCVAVVVNVLVGAWLSNVLFVVVSLFSYKGIVFSRRPPGQQIMFSFFLSVYQDVASVFEESKFWLHSSCFDLHNRWIVQRKVASRRGTRKSKKDCI